MDDILGGPPAPTYNPKVDADFVAIYVETGDPLIAATRAGIQTADSSIIITAQRYLNRPEIRAAIDVVQQLDRGAANVKVTRESIVESCQAVFENAQRDRQYGSAIAALKLQSSLMGLLEQKIKISHSYKVSDMSDAELQRIASGAIIDGQFTDITGDEAS